ncbi:hypothetical protein C8R47DRAFT_1066082 [Mycena vitilis]|nr:hypothetical protein C8R47DRAFT_1066082 [Mycena vitilis]
MTWQSFASAVGLNDTPGKFYPMDRSNHRGTNAGWQLDPTEGSNNRAVGSDPEVGICSDCVRSNGSGYKSRILARRLDLTTKWDFNSTALHDPTTAAEIRAGSWIRLPLANFRGVVGCDRELENLPPMQISVVWLDVTASWKIFPPWSDPTTAAEIRAGSWIRLPLANFRGVVGCDRELENLPPMQISVVWLDVTASWKIFPPWSDPTTAAEIRAGSWIRLPLANFRGVVGCDRELENLPPMQISVVWLDVTASWKIFPPWSDPTTAAEIRAGSWIRLPLADFHGVVGCDRELENLPPWSDPTTAAEIRAGSWIRLPLANFRGVVGCDRELENLPPMNFQLGGRFQPHRQNLLGTVGSNGGLVNCGGAVGSGCINQNFILVVGSNRTVRNSVQLDPTVTYEAPAARSDLTCSAQNFNLLVGSNPPETDGRSWLNLGEFQSGGRIQLQHREVLRI